MQINSNRTEPSLVSKPRSKLFPNWTLQSFPWPVLLYVMVHYHEAKLLCVKSFTLRILKIYPLFIVSHNSVEKWLSFVASTISQVVFRFSCCLSFSSCGTHFPTFWIFPMAFKRMETFFVSCLIDQRVVVAFERHPHPTMLAISCLETFSLVFHVLRYSRQNCHFWIF